MPSPEASPKRIRVLIVDDHPMTREGLVHLIANQPDLMVCAEAATAGSALDAALSTKPDLVLADITLPDKSGIELIKDLKSVHPGLPVLVISMHDESLYAERALKAGASGYIMKVAGAEKLMEAIRRVLTGEVYVSGTIAAHILKSVSGKAVSGTHSSVEFLSDREFEIFGLIARGIATRDIGERLHLSPKTVEAHRMNIKAKLGIDTAAELISYAARWMVDASRSEGDRGPSGKT
jgi:DNA-binding NarL/FixJ family response regulator